MLMNVKQYNPFSDFREHQEDVIKEIIEIEETEIPNIILKAPVASGKSLIAYTIKSLSVLCPSVLFFLDSAE